VVEIVVSSTYVTWLVIGIKILLLLFLLNGNNFMVLADEFERGSAVWAFVAKFRAMCYAIIAE
jgi:hypothetical protein